MREQITKIYPMELCMAFWWWHHIWAVRPYYLGGLGTSLV